MAADAIEKWDIFREKIAKSHVQTTRKEPRHSVLSQMHEGAGSQSHVLGTQLEYILSFLFFSERNVRPFYHLGMHAASFPGEGEL